MIESRARLTAGRRFCTVSPYTSEMAMKEVKVTELRQNLPAYLSRVRKGERVRISSRLLAVARKVVVGPR